MKINRTRSAVLLFLILVAGSSALMWMRQRDNPTVGTEAPRLAAGATPLPGFSFATGPTEILFPEDFGAHPDFQTEWWYYTGNLFTPDGRHFGYQLTFFRRALVPQEAVQPRDTDWSADQIYLAHFALTDTQAEDHLAFEKISRGAAGLAGAANAPFQVWLESWRVEQTGADTFQVVAAEGQVSINFNLRDLKQPVLQGEQGYSQKGLQAGNASYYFSQTRLETQGEITTAEGSFSVEGWSWMDHEYSTSALAADQIGWDWFALQFETGEDETLQLYELMVFQLRRADGNLDEFSSGALIYPDGRVELLGRDHFSIQVADTWQSPHTEAVYPAAWDIQVDAVGLELQARPYLADQELNLRYAYWEGAVSVTGTLEGEALTGNGYVELTGYAGSMAGEF